jgi:NADP-dependent 3-hydroxy acid dehydrogenase YdfG
MQISNTLTLAIRPLISNDVAEAAVFMLSQPLNSSIKALDIVPSGMYLDIECEVLDLLEA